MGIGTVLFRLLLLLLLLQLCAGSFHFIAFGDSLTAGVGLNDGFGFSNGSWFAWTPTPPQGPYPRCDVSYASYVNLVASAHNGTLQTFACSGASIEKGLLSAQFDEVGVRRPPQVRGNAAVPALSSDVVLLSIGANDVRFSTGILACNVAAQNEEPFCSFDEPGPHLDHVLAQLTPGGSLEQAMRSVLEEIVQTFQASGPVPFIRLMTYPNLFMPVFLPCPDLAFLRPAQLAFLRHTLSLLNGVIRRAASNVHPKVAPVEMESLFEGHELCSPDPWVYGLSILLSHSSDAPLHPTHRGHAAIAQAVLQSLPRAEETT